MTHMWLGYAYDIFFGGNKMAAGAIKKIIGGF